MWANDDDIHEHLSHLFFTDRRRNTRENLRKEVQYVGMKDRTPEHRRGVESWSGEPDYWWKATLGPIAAHGPVGVTNQVAYEFDDRWLWWESWGPGDGEYSHDGPPWADC